MMSFKYSEKFKFLRPLVLYAYGYSCLLCSLKSKSNHIHHGDFNRLNDDIFNYVVLCNNCHKATHSARIFIDPTQTPDIKILLHSLEEIWLIVK
jgi:5-methylcytosine-specific restriction endonuclease McrA